MLGKAWWGEVEKLRQKSKKKKTQSARKNIWSLEESKVPAGVDPGSWGRVWTPPPMVNEHPLQTPNTENWALLLTPPPPEANGAKSGLGQPEAGVGADRLQPLRKLLPVPDVVAVQLVDAVPEAQPGPLRQGPRHEVGHVQDALLVVRVVQHLPGASMTQAYGKAGKHRHI